MNTIHPPRRRELALAIAVSVALTACGGGSTGVRGSSNLPSGSVPSNNLPPGSTSSNNLPPGSVPSNNLPDKGNGSGNGVSGITPPPTDVQITGTNAAPAIAGGFTGAGVKIAIVDSGVSAASPALAGRVTDKFNYVDPASNNLAVDDVLGHGTIVAELAAGKPFGNFAGGIAQDANLVSLRILADKEPKDDGSGQGNKVTGADAAGLGAIFDDAVGAGAHIINNSYGGLYWDATDTDTTASFDDAYLQAAFGNALFVFAAGNSGAANPSDLAALPSRAGNLEKGWLTVVALDSAHTDQIAAYSNRCGIAKNYCLAAPGTVVALAADSTAANPKYVIGQGTSFAAPLVSGAAAVVYEQNYTNLDGIRQVLLGTADDLGTPGPDEVFGYGRLNVGRAVLGPARLDWGTFRADFSRDFTFANDISGSGGLDLSGNNGATLTLSGNNTYTGDTAVSSSLVVNALHGIPGSLHTSNHALVNLTGDIGGAVDNRATLATGDTSTHVTGDFTQTVAGSLSQKLGAPLIVSGTATLAGNFNIAGAVPGYVVTTHQQVVTAGSVVGQFNSLTRSQGVFLTSTLQYLPTEVWIDTSQLSITQVAATSMSRSMAAQSSAARLDGAFAQINKQLAVSAAGGAEASIDTSTLVAAGAIQQAPTTASARASLESLSGQLYAANTAVTLAGIDAGNDALMQHLDQGGTGSWTQSLGSQGGLSRGGFGNVDFNLGGNLIGHDLRFGTSGFAGVAVSQLSSNGQLSNSVDRQSSRTTEGMLYAGSRAEHWYGVGRFGFGSFRGTTQRLLRLGQDATFAGGDNTGHYNAAYGEFGYRTNAGAFTLTPFANLEYASIRRNGFEESGGDGFGLATDGHTTSRWQAGFGLRAGSSWLTSYGKVRLDAKLGWQNAFATKGEVFSARYNGVAQWAPVDGIGLSRRAGTAGLNLALDMSEHTQLGFNVDQRFADRDHSRSASASFRMNW